MTVVLDPTSMVVGALGCAGMQGMLVLLAAAVMAVVRRPDRDASPPGPRAVR